MTVCFHCLVFENVWLMLDSSSGQRLALSLDCIVWLVISMQLTLSCKGGLMLISIWCSVVCRELRRLSLSLCVCTCLCVCLCLCILWSVVLACVCWLWYLSKDSFLTDANTAFHSKIFFVHTCANFTWAMVFYCNQLVLCHIAVGWCSNSGEIIILTPTNLAWETYWRKPFYCW